MTILLPAQIRVLLPDGAVQTLPLEQYVAGVIRAALSVDAPLQALKAQAVTARTFAASTRRHLDHGAEVCAERHCQVWRVEVSVAARQAAEETRSIIAAYQGRPIDAYYFEHCDGMTRDAGGVLVEPRPYLKGVSCPCGFATLKGHGIGLCQRGALVMARQGDAFEKILRHYYSGIELLVADVIPMSGTVSSEPLLTEKVASPAPPFKPRPRPSPRPARQSRPAAPPVEPAQTPPDDARLAETYPTSSDLIAPDASATGAIAPAPAEALLAPPDAAPALALPPTPAETPPDSLAAAPALEPAQTPLAPSIPALEPPPAPESMPEELPVIPTAPAAVESQHLPVREQVQERPSATSSEMLIDYLPGPRVIAGNLARPGIIVTISDTAENAVITVSGAAPQQGPGGFEAPLPTPGRYRVRFQELEITVELRDETAFIRSTDRAPLE